MQITHDTLKGALGRKYDSSKEYILTRHAEEASYIHRGFTREGEVQDFTSNETGTMLIMARKEPQ